MEDVASGDAIAACTNLLSVRYSFENSNSSIDSIGSPERQDCLFILHNLHNCQEKRLGLLRAEVARCKGTASIFCGERQEGWFSPLETTREP
jgi:hypothetical protein